MGNAEEYPGLKSLDDRRNRIHYYLWCARSGGFEGHLGYGYDPDRDYSEVRVVGEWRDRKASGFPRKMLNRWLMADTMDDL
jgi:hypothetical protein